LFLFIYYSLIISCANYYFFFLSSFILRMNNGAQAQPINNEITHRTIHFTFSSVLTVVLNKMFVFFYYSIPLVLSYLPYKPRLFFFSFYDTSLKKELSHLQTFFFLCFFLHCYIKMLIVPIHYSKKSPSGLRITSYYDIFRNKEKLVMTNNND